MSSWVALLRGVNLGAQRKLDMADLRAALTGLGHTEVRTYLRSGNAVFTAGPGGSEPVAARIEERLAAETGLRTQVLLRTADELRAAVEGNPLTVSAPARFLVAFLSEPFERERLADLDLASFAPERLGTGERELYLDFPDGIRNAKLSLAVSRRLPPMTMRNWNTVNKLLTLADG